MSAARAHTAIRFDDGAGSDVTGTRVAGVLAGATLGGRGISGTVGMAGAVGGTNPACRPLLTARNAVTVSPSVGRRSGSERNNFSRAAVSGPLRDGTTGSSSPSGPNGGLPSTARNRVAPRAYASDSTVGFSPRFTSGAR